jgi:hypothetical protein
VPHPGDLQQYLDSSRTQAYILEAVITQTLPFSRFVWLAMISLVDKRSDNFGIVIPN